MADIFSGMNQSLMRDNPTPEENMDRAAQLNAHLSSIAANAFLSAQERAVKEKAELGQRAGFIELGKYLAGIDDWSDPKYQIGALEIISKNGQIANSPFVSHLMDNFKAAQAAKIAKENGEQALRERAAIPQIQAFEKRVSLLPPEDQASISGMSNDATTFLPSAAKIQALSLAEQRLGIVNQMKQVDTQDEIQHAINQGMVPEVKFGKNGKEVTLRAPDSMKEGHFDKTVSVVYDPETKQRIGLRVPRSNGADTLYFDKTGKIDGMTPQQRAGLVKSIGEMSKMWGEATEGSATKTILANGMQEALTALGKEVQTNTVPGEIGFFGRGPTTTNLTVVPIKKPGTAPATVVPQAAPSSTPTAPPPDATGGVLSEEQEAAFLKLANGDKAKASELARQAGYTASQGEVRPAMRQNLLPLPKTKAELVEGQLYDTAKGPAVWTGTVFQP